MPPAPVVRKPATQCDCISIYNPNTRWRLAFRNNVVHHSAQLWAFAIWAVPSEECAEVTFRTGFCCDQTLQDVELRLDMTQYNSTYWQLTKHYWLVNPNNMVLQEGPISTLQWSDMGLIFRNFGSLKPDDYPAGQELILILELNSTMYNNMAAFPCGQSALVEVPGLCDYSLYGEQVVDGEVLNANVTNPLLKLPDCCPDGVFDTTPLPAGCGCADNKLDSPYRLEVENPNQNGDTGSTQWNYRLRAVDVEAGARETGDVDCSLMDLDMVRLYIRPELVDQVLYVRLNNQPVSFRFGGDDLSATWLELTDLGLQKPGTGTSWPLQVVMKPSAPLLASLCAPNSLGTAECEYVMSGSWSLYELDYLCCAHGFSDPDTFTTVLPTQSCDANVLHSPYSVEVAGSQYSAASDTTLLNFKVAWLYSMCDEDDPTNTRGCCMHDLKSIFLGVDPAKVTGVSSNPDRRPQLYRVDNGVKVSGLFGQGSGFTLTLSISGKYDAPLSLTTGNTLPSHGFRYRLFGGVDLNEPLGCCPTYVTGDGSSLIV